MTTGAKSEEYTLNTLGRFVKDNGCSEHDDCLTCPLPSCIYDTNMGAVHLRTAERHNNIKQMYKYHSVKEIAKQLSISIRTIQRALKEQ